MATYEEIRLYRNEYNAFPREVGITTLEIKEGYAKAELRIQPNHLNVIHSVHGGLIFTLADTVAGSAASSCGNKMTTLNCNMNYLSPAIDVERLYGEAKEIKGGKTISVYQVEIFDEKDKLIARGDFTYYNLKKPLMP